jgi:hypothetical protein
MNKALYILLGLCLTCLPVSAELYDAIACNHSTGSCYDAEADTGYETVTIYLTRDNYLTLDLEYYSPDDISAYDSDNKVYYDIELLK